MKMFWSVRNSF